MRLAAPILILALLTACVAPEAPEPPPAAPQARYTPPPGTQLEDAPIPNNTVRGPNSSVIRFAR